MPPKGKRVYLTISPALMKLLEIWAEKERRPTANLATYLVEGAIEEEVRAGRLKLPDADQPSGVSDTDQRAQLAKDRLIEAISKGEKPKKGDVSIAAHALHLDARTLNHQINKTIEKKNGNPSPA